MHGDGPLGRVVVVEEPAKISVGRFGLGECRIDGGRASELTAGYANANKITGPNAGGPHQLSIWMSLTARVDQFCRSAIH